MLDKIVAVLDAHYLLDSMFDGTSLRSIHLFACFFGSIMALYVMQLWTVGALTASSDCWFARHSRRFALLLVALSMLWSISYQGSTGWSPWPSDVALCFAIDLFLLSSIVVAFKKKRALG